VNLLSNATKFTPPGGHIRITCDQVQDGQGATQLPGPGSFLRVTVEDTGIGIPSEKLQSIFEPFYQVDAGHTREISGTGLGLAISRNLARLMGGDLTVESGLGTGSRFSLWLPGGEEDPAGRGA
jgi:signal transduction histidine kinase